MPSVRPTEASVVEFQQLLQGAIAPRPIAFASTIDKVGNVNLSPFSFFNVFSAAPPVLIFSPARRIRDNTTKHTLENVLEVPEVVVNIGNYSMVQQMSLSSTEYRKGTNEFVKAGFTELKSDLVGPPRVKEAPVSFECRVLEVKPLGDSGGAGNLIICEVLIAHVSETILDETGRIDPFRLDAISRMGGSWYCRAQGAALFQVAKPLTTVGIGVDRIPASIRSSKILTGNHLGKLGNVEKLPSEEEVVEFAKEPEVSAIMEIMDADPEAVQLELHKLASYYLDAGEVDKAWRVLLQEY